MLSPRINNRYNMADDESENCLTQDWDELMKYAIILNLLLKKYYNTTIQATLSSQQNYQ